ncbi:MAG TPA: cupin domain-containing protein [Ktedonobacteraceae bacterium]|nr:cupin domain-containing protein [Ktedonobacteraceae bacterium]
MTDHSQLKHVRPDQGSTYRARAGLYTFKLLAKDTNGAFTLSEAFNPPTTGVPPHIQHLEDETFIVLQGKYLFRVGDKVLQCGPGEVIYVPRGVPHAFENASTEPARMLILQAPGGIHEQYFAEAWEPIEDLATLPPEAGPPDFEKIRAAAQRHGIEMVPPPAH